VRKITRHMVPDTQEVAGLASTLPLIRPKENPHSISSLRGQRGNELPLGNLFPPFLSQLWKLGRTHRGKRSYIEESIRINWSAPINSSIFPVLSPVIKCEKNEFMRISGIQILRSS
jgi:hypothetical protein